MGIASPAVPLHFFPTRFARTPFSRLVELAASSFLCGDRHGRLWRKLSIAQQYSMTRNGIHSATCFASSIHIPKLKASVSTIQKIPSKTSSWRDVASLLVMYRRNFHMAYFLPEPAIESVILLLITKLQGDSHPASPAGA